ncbi:30S ribosome-binding factor RbfA [Algoriphagus halophytocola]|uniref:Ribosome-binding factor A n=1 Tax=Algoriphagus halophytocola TaxID=2991499 RepID=A0ABY6MDC5_9BACT|nr:MULTISPECIES: 30S ribosome-binding factor RbfA [unclassified Algoriphagus]UZD21720.1 30S ribosome-binding factor RbfA [Algoriphagus sp. TR-M5]WBL42932.1 30S ribosome-binding factor RbfA [Algoriphagus sp. TR-M9]
MESKRQQKYSKLIQKELGDIFQKESRHLVGRAMVTITRVLMSPDLGLAKVYLSFLLADPEETYKLINEHKKEIRHQLAKRIGKSVRVIPEIAFFPDESAAYAQHMDKVISDLDIPEADEEDSEEDED